jgi:lipopolysaccharide biosynthesis glycosyltransferase
MKVFVGYDSREDIAYQVCRHSILRHQPDAEVIPLKLKELKGKNLYWRPEDKLGSTEFTISRFLVPHLADYTGWAVFVDCDFLWQADIKELFDLADDQYAVMVVQHDYQPSNSVKMDGKGQYQYPRKNWSSMILWNCGHPSNSVVTPELVNSETGAFLHRFQWLKDEEIGSISHEWNWLVNWYKEPENGKPKAIHYTEGGPWFENYKDCEYHAEWEKALIEIELEKTKKELDEALESPYNKLPEQYTQLFKTILNYSIDPNEYFYENTKEQLSQGLNTIMGNKVAAIASDVISKERKFDSILENFIMGSRGYISTWDREENTITPLVIRGVGGGSQKAIRHCWHNKRTFYAIDTGYFGNDGKKMYHRVTKNNLQHLGPIIDRPFDRVERIGWKFNKFTPGRKILICPPSAKVMGLFDKTIEQWMEETIATIKAHTDRPIEIRLKPIRSERVTSKTMSAALADDVHCLVTYNSIAATEAIMLGKPAFALGPNAANMVALSDLSKIEKPYIPTKEKVEAFVAHLSYCQFTVDELKNGYAWNIVNQ